MLLYTYEGDIMEDSQDNESRMAGRAAELSQDEAAMIPVIMHMSAALASYKSTDTIRSGVKTGQPTVSVPVRMLKSQAEMLKAAAYSEGRPTTAIIRDLLDMYFAAKKHSPDESERTRFWRAYMLQEPTLSEPQRGVIDRAVEMIEEQWRRYEEYMAVREG
jgi:hypothetical protein